MEYGDVIQLDDSQLRRLAFAGKPVDSFWQVIKTLESAEDDGAKDFVGVIQDLEDDSRDLFNVFTSSLRVLFESSDIQERIFGSNVFIESGAKCFACNPFRSLNSLALLARRITKTPSGNVSETIRLLSENLQLWIRFSETSSLEFVEWAQKHFEDSNEIVRGIARMVFTTASREAMETEPETTIQAVIEATLAGYFEPDAVAGFVREHLEQWHGHLGYVAAALDSVSSSRRIEPIENIVIEFQSYMNSQPPR